MKRLKRFAGQLNIIWLLALLIGWAVAAIFGSKAQAQDNPSGAGKVWTLQECVEYAWKNSIQVQQSNVQTQITTNNLLQSRVARLPNANANASQNFAWGRSIDPFTNTFVNQQVNSNNFSISTGMTIFNGGRINNTIKQNRATLEANQYTEQQTRNTVALNIALSYLNVLLNKELIAVAEKNIASTREQLDRTEKLFKAGSIAEADVFNLKATLANNELNLINAQNQLASAKAILQQQMNYPVRDDFDVQTVAIEGLSVDNFTETPTQIYKTAEASQPSVRSADANIRAQDWQIEVARSGYYPTLSMNGALFTGYSSATKRSIVGDTRLVTQTIGLVNGDPTLPVTTTIPVTDRSIADYKFRNQLEDNFRQNVGFTLSIPIFNQWQARNNVQNARLSRRNAELTAQNTRNQLRQDIEQAYINARSAYATYQARTKQVEAQELSFMMQERRYNAGATNLADFNISRNNRDAARSDLVRAKYDYLFRKKVLDFYQDKPLTIE